MNTDVKEKNSSLIQFLNDNNIFEFKRQKILGDASHRLYERIIYSDDKGNDKSYILMLDKDLEQINRFKYIGEFLYNINISVPKIYATDEQNGLLLIEDLKVDSFSLILAGASILSKNNAVNRKLYRYAIAAISKMQRAKISIKLEDFSKDKYKE